MANRANPLAVGARFVARSIARVIGAGASVVRSSTQGLQDLYAEAREEYEADRASMRSVGPRPSPEQPNLAVPGSVSERIQATVDGRSQTRKRSASPASGGRRKSTGGEAPVALYGPDGTPIRKKPGRPAQGSAATRSTAGGSAIVMEPAGKALRRKPGPKPRAAKADSDSAPTRKKTRAGSKADHDDGAAGTRRGRKKISPAASRTHENASESGAPAEVTSPAHDSVRTDDSGESSNA